MAERGGGEMNLRGDDDLGCQNREKLDRTRQRDGY